MCRCLAPVKVSVRNKKETGQNWDSWASSKVETSTIRKERHCSSHIREKDLADPQAFRDNIPWTDESKVVLLNGMGAIISGIKQIQHFTERDHHTNS
uniref:Uncharacterized protein n=1 Tax=Anguilla anguilla TaxID=7936 RepID=A0A0E9SZR0_ANGAN